MGPCRGPDPGSNPGVGVFLLIGAVMVVNETCQMISALWSQYEPYLIMTGVVLTIVFIMSGVGFYLFVKALKKNRLHVIQDLLTILLGVAGGLIALYADKFMSTRTLLDGIFFFTFTVLDIGAFVWVSSWFRSLKRKNKQ